MTIKLPEENLELNVYWPNGGRGTDQNSGHFFPFRENVMQNKPNSSVPKAQLGDTNKYQRYMFLLEKCK